MFLWTMVVIFGSLSIALLLGKGSFLIAGYNTASAQEKARYDEKKLCQVMGIGMLLITFSLVLLALFKEEATFISCLMMLASVIFILVASHIVCLDKNNHSIQSEKYKKRSMISLILGVVTCVVIGIILFTGNIDVQFYDDYFTAGSSGWATKTIQISYDDIDEMQYVSDIELGKRVWGVGSPIIQSGSFKNELYGRYKLYSYTQCRCYIVIQMDNQYIVINDKDEQKTLELYKNLQLKIKNRESH